MGTLELVKSILNGEKIQDEEIKASKNIFSRGDFDEYKISDEELLEHQEDIEKAHKYIRRWFSNGEWHYLYPAQYKQMSNRNKTKIEFAKKTPLITNIKPMFDATEEQIDNAILQMSLYAMDGKLKCPSLGNSSIYVETKTQEHIKITKGKRRPVAEMQHKAQYIPFIPEIIKNGILCEKSSSSKGVIYGVIGQVEYTNKKGNIVKEAVELAINYDESTDKFVFSFSNYEIKKSLFSNKDSKDNFLACPIVDTETVPITIYRIAEYKKKSSNIKKSLTYSGHKLQGRTKLYGMDISIENKKGSYRCGIDSDGHKWRTYMNYDYGYIRGTVGTDGDHLDCYVGPDKEAQKVYVIHQNNPVTHKYDEDKCMLCFESADAAKKAYMKQYDRPGFFGNMDVLTIEQFKTFVFSQKGSKIHKSFDVVITDITENNKEKKIDQLEKSLNALYENKPFTINHIDSDNSKKFDNITVRIKDFDKEKISKAVRTLSFSLDTELKAPKGEAFTYKAQEDLTNMFVKELTEKTKELYTMLVAYFGLPEMRILTKANLVYKGKVVYSPETGKPISEKDWAKFVDALEKFLNRNYKGIGKRIVLSADALGRILDRLTDTKKLEEIKKLRLDELKYKGKKLEWISDSVKNMSNTFGESLSRIQQARIQVMTQSAAQRITKVTDAMRNDIQQILIDGVKDHKSKSQVSQALFDKCVGLNRDFQRIADTEIQNATNEAYVNDAVYNAKEGEKVYFKRYEVLDGNTCKKCESLKGKIALWSDVPLGSQNIQDEYADIAIWEGCGLMDKDGIPIGTAHPWCRGHWRRCFPEVEKEAKEIMNETA